jgi:hypothetical protein
VVAVVYSLAAVWEKALLGINQYEVSKKLVPTCFPLEIAREKNPKAWSSGFEQSRKGMLPLFRHCLYRPGCYKIF